MSTRQIKSQKEQDLTSRHAHAGLDYVVRNTNYGKVIMSESNLVNEQDCPCFMGGSCPTDYNHLDDQCLTCGGEGCDK